MKFLKLHFFILSVLLISCDKEGVNYVLDDFIQAGQKSGAGIDYVDFEPDINCTIIDPWVETDTFINLDFNKDGVIDITISGTMCHPSLLGVDCENLSIVPLLNSEICINPVTNWLDTIPYFDSINSNKDWTKREAPIYSYFWDINGNTSSEGYWKDVLTDNRYYIGFRIVKDEKYLYGWIGMKRDPTILPFSYLLTDYAILKEYAE